MVKEVINAETRRYFEILGITEKASAAEIKSAYRKLAHRYHPDISAEENAKEKFVEVVDAYRALTAQAEAEAKIKSAFNFKKTSGKRRATSADFQAQKDIPYSQNEHAEKAEKIIFGKSSSVSSRSKATLPIKGKDCYLDALISVEELYWGVQLKVNTSTACPGRRHSKSNPHHVKLLSVKIQRGTRNGTRLRLRGQGEEGENGGEAGDIYLTIKLKSHDRYEVNGDNIYVDMPLSRWEAQYGGSIDLVTPGGRIEVNVPAGITSGQSVRISQRGLPSANSGYGDLFAVARLVNAENRTEDLRKWPHVTHADSTRWRSTAAPRGGKIDVLI